MKNPDATVLIRERDQMLEVDGWELPDGKWRGRVKCPHCYCLISGNGSTLFRAAAAAHQELRKHIQSDHGELPTSTADPRALAKLKNVVPGNNLE